VIGAKCRDLKGLTQDSGTLGNDLAQVWVHFGPESPHPDARCQLTVFCFKTVSFIGPEAASPWTFIHQPFGQTAFKRVFSPAGDKFQIFSYVALVYLPLLWLLILPSASRRFNWLRQKADGKCNWHRYEQVRHHSLSGLVNRVKQGSLCLKLF